MFSKSEIYLTYFSPFGRPLKGLCGALSLPSFVTFCPVGSSHLAGFCLGVLESGKEIVGTKIKKGDAIIGIPSSGIHSNGYSLVRKIFEFHRIDYFDKPSFSTGKTWMDYLLEPTRIYVKEVLNLCAKVNVLGMVHITGGGFQENINRVVPEKFQAVIDAKSWKVPDLFVTLQGLGQVPADEMYRTFNMGIGYVVVVNQKDAAKTLKLLKGSKQIGTVEARKKGDDHVKLVF